MNEAKKQSNLFKIAIDDTTLESQWTLFADEYNIPDGAELLKDDPMTSILRQLKAAWFRMIRAGMVEIVSDSEDGVVVKQYISHRVEGLNGDPQCLVWRAPTVATVAQARMGTKSSEETPSAQQYMKYAASATGVSEGVLIQLRGGDQSRMGTIAQLFLTA